jgi:hypothetical protein
LAVGVVIGILFLEETHEKKKHRRDYGIELGKIILASFRRCTNSSPRREKNASLEEFQSLLEDEQPPGYRTTAGSPHLLSTPSPDPQEPLSLSDEVTPPAKPAASKAFTKQVVLNIVGYGILA